MKKLTILSLIILSSLLLSSCISKYVKKDRQYSETFNRYYASKHTGELVFIGRKYHYVLKDKNNLTSEFIKEKWRSKIKISNINLSVDSNNQITGSVDLNIFNVSKILSSKEIKTLEKFGFTREEDEFLTKKVKLNGIRYKSGGSYKRDGQGKLSRHYRARIKYKLDSKERARKAALTPVAYAADGALILIGGVWIPLVIIAMTDN